MPSSFKALASISVWILFIVGCWLLFISLPIPFFHLGWEWQRLAIGIASIFLSVIMIRLRKTLE